MNFKLPQQCVILILIVSIFPSVTAIAQLKEGNKYDEISTKDGAIYKSVTITQFNSEEIKFIYSEGVKKLRINELNPSSLGKLGLGIANPTDKANIDEESEEGMTNPVESLLVEWEAKGLAFKPGEYEQGKIPEGTYVWLQPLNNKDRGVYGFLEYDPANNVVTIENFDAFGYVHVNGIGKVEPGGWLIKPKAVTNSKYRSPRTLFMAHRNLKSYNFSGTYYVGLDIEPGRYIFKKVGNLGSVSTYVNGPPGKSTNNLTLVEDQDVAITVTKGTFINVEKCLISR